MSADIRTQIEKSLKQIDCVRASQLRPRLPSRARAARP